MNIGGYQLYSIETSGFSLDGGAMFGIIPKTMWEKKRQRTIRTGSPWSPVPYF